MCAAAFLRSKMLITQDQDDQMKKLFSISGVLSALTAAPAWAQDGLEVIGRPVDGAMGFQPLQPNWPAACSGWTG